MERAQLKAFVLALGCAVERGPFVFLQDSNWGPQERAQAEAIFAVADGHAAPVELGWLCIPTGGSSGRVRFARHDELTLSAAVNGFREHFRIRSVNTLGVLPPYHVSGLMARFRSAKTAGAYLDGSWKEIERGTFPKLGRGDWVISLVPTQLQRLLAKPEALAWLRAFRIIFIGGAPIWKDLADSAAAAHLPLSLGYGSTETAAMAAGLLPEEFLQGERSSGAPLSHARIEILDTETGAALGPEKIGQVQVSGESIFRGYFPDFRAERRYLTEDLGFLDAAGGLHIEGRRDAVVITGGEKVFPSEVEAALRASGQFIDIAVLGLPDREWGEIVVACHPTADQRVDAAKLEAALKSLSPYKRPKRIFALTTWPRNEQGKLNRAALRAAVLAASAEANPLH